MLVSEAELLHLILAGITGALILFLFLFSIFYFSQVKGAERERDEAITLASQAMAARDSAQAGFEEMKKVFDEKMKMPVAAIITQEQLDYISRYLAERLMLSTARDLPAIKN